MSLSADPKGIAFQEPPARGLAVELRCKWHQDPVFLRDVRASLYVDRNGSYVRLTHDVFLPGFPHIVKTQAEWNSTFDFPLSHDALRAIESARRGDVRLRIDLQFGAAMVRDFAPNGVVPLEVLLRPGLDRRDIIIDVPQSEWIKGLRKLEWDQVEIVEIHRGALVEYPELREAFELLSAAQAASWQHDYRKVAADCWGAFESLFRTFGENKTKAGADALWEALFPGDTEQQKLINAFVKEFRELMQQYRHANAPLRRPSREDAELFLSTTHRTFSLVSRSFAERRKPNP